MIRGEFYRYWGKWGGCMKMKFTDPKHIYPPIVLMDRIIENNEFITSVVVDNYPVMCELIQVLVNRGFNKFGYIGGWKNTLDNKERYSGLLDTLSKNNIAFDEEKYYFDGNYHEESGYEAVNKFLEGGSLPEVLVCANDDMALGAIQALKERNFKIPEDILVTGNNRQYFSSLYIEEQYMTNYNCL